jgi:tetratricopeptide (TPR) repeat protein
VTEAGKTERLLDQSARCALYAALLYAAVASGAYRDWSLAVVQLLTLLALLGWLFLMLAERRLTWRRTSLDLPLALLGALVLLQLALGNGPLTTWALAPPPGNPALPVELPAPLLTIGTISPAQTDQSLLLLLTYAGVYVLVVNLVRARLQLARLVRTLLLFGGLLAFLGLLDYLAGEAWLIRWRDYPFTRGRLSGTFVNPDHFAAWLAMLVCLGLGYLAARRRAEGRGLSFSAILRSREVREHALRRYLPFISVAVMALALVFTLSRGGLLSLLFALFVLLGLLRGIGRIRWSLAVVGALLAVTLAYGTWIGLAPLLERLGAAGVGFEDRWVQYRSTVPMLRDFPLLGVGLGAYKDIYYRYQPIVHNPGKVYYPYAHNDLLQFAVETGLAGTMLLLFAMWRVARDLIGAHVLGRGRCPVGGGEGEGARRNDPFSLGVALGALGGVVALVAHSGAEFAARIPANGFLGAALLGIATVALHTRFTPAGDRALTTAKELELGPGRAIPAVGGVLAVALAGLVAVTLIRPARVEAKREESRSTSSLASLAEAVRLDPRNPRTLAARAAMRLQTSMSLVWYPDRAAEARSLIEGAVSDLRGALTLTPTDPFLHERLASTYGARAFFDRDAADVSRALAHFNRSLALAPENPFLYRSLSHFALTQRESLLDIGLRAGAAAVQRDPGLLTGLVDRYVHMGLADTQWLALVPGSPVARLRLALLLEARGLPSPATRLSRGAIELGPPPQDEPVYRWLLARLLLAQGDHQGALREAEAALDRDQGNPELHLTRGDVLKATGDPGALDAYRTAVGLAEQRTGQRAAGPFLPFMLADLSTRSLIAERTGAGTGKYRKALASHLTERKLWEQAIREWEVVLAEEPQDAAAHFSLGLALDGVGAAGRALEEYRTAVALDGGPSRFRERLARRLWETEQYYQAMAHWRAIVAQEPRNVDARLSLARAYAKIGDRIESFREYLRILEIQPGHAAARAEISRIRGRPSGN